jgi:hypothetical protein
VTGIVTDVRPVALNVREQLYEPAASDAPWTATFTVEGVAGDVADVAIELHPLPVLTVTVKVTAA